MSPSLVPIDLAVDRDGAPLGDSCVFSHVYTGDRQPTAAFLRHEMKQRSCDKPLIISDTTPTPFIAWGPATRATGRPQQLGIVVPPATEADRPRLAAYFTKLVDKDGTP